MRTNRPPPLIITEVRFSAANDEVSRRKISEVYKLLLSIRKGKEQTSNKKATPTPSDNNGRTAPEPDGR